MMKNAKDCYEEYKNSHPSATWKLDQMYIDAFNKGAEIYVERALEIVKTELAAINGDNSYDFAIDLLYSQIMNKDKGKNTHPFEKLLLDTKQIIHDLKQSKDENTI